MSGLAGKIEEGEFIVIGLGVLAFLAFGGYEIIENWGLVKSVVGEGVKIVEEGEAVEEIGKDIVGGNFSNAREDYLRLEAGDNAVAWIMLFGSDQYNDGFGSFRYAALRENAEVLAGMFGNPGPYLRRVGVSGMTRGGIGELRISPFEIRQNLNRLVFSGDLHGLGGGDALALKNFIWSDWDRIIEWASGWSTLEEVDKMKVFRMRDEDIQRSVKMSVEGSDEAWIIIDRVKSWREILLQYQIAG